MGKTRNYIKGIGIRQELSANYFRQFGKYSREGRS